MSVVHTDSHQVGYAGATCGRKYQCFHGKSRETSVPYINVRFTYLLTYFSGTGDPMMSVKF